MKEVLHCGICGLGRIGWHFHLPAIKGTDGMEVTAAADPLRERAEEAARVHGVPHIFTDWREMADAGIIDLVVIASPTSFHREQCEYFMSRGVDVFCDKPMALTYQDALAMADAARKYGKKLMVYQPHRLTELAFKAGEIIRSGKLGKIWQIKRSIYSFVRRNDWQAFSAQGGGMLNNYGAHFLDQLLFLGGENKVEAIRCETERILSGGDAEDVVSVAMRGRKGILYKLEINMAGAIPVPEMEIFGDKGSACFQGGEWRLKYGRDFSPLVMNDSLAAPGRGYPPGEKDLIEETAENPTELPARWYDLCRDFYNGTAEPFVPLAETLEVMRLLEECRKSSASFWNDSL